MAQSHSYEMETIAPAANGTVSDTTQIYASRGGDLLLETQETTSANGLVKVSYTAVNGDTSWDFSTADIMVLNSDGSTTEMVAT